MYSKLPNLVLGFHGCSKAVYDKVIHKGENLKESSNSYDWLGHGIYFWEQNYQRALEWAKNRYGNEATVIGAILDLGYCLNLTDSASVDVLRKSYNILKATYDAAGIELPINRKSDKSKDVLLRELDCMVIQHVHEINISSGMIDFDSVRGIFTEGNPIYPGSEILEKTHTQVCICNPNCIKGYFEPKKINQRYPMP